MKYLAKYCLPLLLCAAGMASAAEPMPIESFLKRPAFRDMKISPDGAHLAATVPQDDDKTILVVLARETMKPTAVLQMRGREHVANFIWVNDERLVVSATKKEGMLDVPIPTGELYGVNADGRRTSMLFGYRMGGGDQATNIKQPKAERASAFLLDTLPNDENHVLVVVYDWDGGDGSLPEVRRLNTGNGRTSVVARAPVPRAWFLSDRQGNVRFAYGDLNSGIQQVHVRSAGSGDWRLLHDESKAGYRIVPLAFDADGKTVLVRKQHAQGPDGLYRLDLESGAETPVFRSPTVDPGELLYGIDPDHYYAVTIRPGKPQLAFLDEQSRETRLAKALADAFPGQHAYATSYTRDGKLGLVRVYSDRNPGEFYLFDLEKMRATYVGGTREWIDPEQMAELRPFAFKARDGMDLHGYLALPPGRDPKNLPLIVNPHGGPHGIRDVWEFDEETQLLASRGYAVMKLNFRGSGGYGRAFETSGYRQWGGAMQDDLADAVKWAVAEGYADTGRVCIYGGSYGGYAALMNAARYPELYRCTVGYVGVYDLPLMYQDGDVRESMWGRAVLEQYIGRSNLSANSPVNHADKIKMPVMLIHGGEDFRVPQTHADRMRKALRDAGNEPEWLLERREGHGFYNMDNRVRMYTQLLAFFDKHIGSPP